MLRLSLLLVVMLGTAMKVHGLSCRACVPEDCEDPPNCKFGFVKGICGCCNVCGKGPGEECGGTWGLLGQCGKGFTCDTTKNSGEGEGNYFRSPFPEGVCVADQKLPEALSAPVNLVSRPTGGSGASGLLGGVRAGQAKKLAQKHKHQAIGSGIPPEYLALLRQNGQGRRKRALPGGSRRAGTSKLTATKHSHTAYGGIPEEYLALLNQYSKQTKRAKRALSGGMRRGGTAKLTATKHTHTAFGGIPEEYRELLKQYRQA